MTKEEAIKLLNVIATNLLGDSVSEKDERLKELMLKEYDAIDMAIKALEKVKTLKDMVEGTIDHFDYDDAMDLLYELKREIER